MKNLNEMTLQELWQLFPIVLSEHKDCWKNWYNEEVLFLKKLLPQAIEFHHIGSTAIKGIMSKPIIDIIIVVNSINSLIKTANILQSQNYIVMSKSQNHISLNKGYTIKGYDEKVFHIHVRLKNDIDEIYFRDYLNDNFKIAKKYEKLKLKLFKKYKHNRDTYTNKKTAFVKKYTKKAKQKHVC